LRERRALSLALVGGAGRHRDLAVGEDPHRDALERPEPGALHIVADADADITALGARAGLPGTEALIVGEAERGRLAAREIAAVVDQRLAVAKDQSDRIGHLVGTDEVAPAQLGAIEI